MENQQSSMYKEAMTYGLYLGGVSVLMTALIWATNLIEVLGLFGSSALGFFQLLVLVVLLIFFTKKYRDKALEGKITFGQAYLFGILMVVFSTFLTACFSYILNAFIDPEYAQRTLTMLQDKTYQWMSSRGVADDQIEQVLKGMDAKGAPTPLETLISSVSFGFIGGAIISLISAAIVKKNAGNEDAFDEAMNEIKPEE